VSVRVQDEGGKERKALGSLLSFLSWHGKYFEPKSVHNGYDDTYKRLGLFLYTHKHVPELSNSSPEFFSSFFLFLGGSPFSVSGLDMLGHTEFSTRG
jgi:hypothetical protein